MSNITSYGRFRNNRIWVLLIVMFILTVNLLNVFYVATYNYTNASVLLVILPATKDLFLVVLCTLALFQASVNVKNKLAKALGPIYLFIVFWGLIVIMYTFLSPAPASYVLYNMRQCLLLFAAFVLFSLIDVDIEEAKINRILSIVCFIVMIFGFLEYVLPMSFWNDIIGLKKYAQSRFLGGTEIDRSYSSDLKFLIGRPVRRMMSFFAEPVTFGSFVTCFYAYFSFSNVNVPYRKLLLVLLFIGGVLVFSKLFIVSVFIVWAYKYVLRKPYFWPLFFFTIILFLTTGYVYSVLGKIHGSFAHFFGFYTGIELILDHPFGFGLGMAGNRGLLEHEIHMGEYGGESGLGNITAQFGFFGLIFLLILILIMAQFKRSCSISPSYFGLFVAFFAYITNFYLSAASLGMSGNIMFFIVGGMFLNPRMKLS